MRKILLIVLAALFAAPLLSACGAPIDPADRPFQDRVCAPGYPSC
ncbi:hypothetical protein [Ferrovibrio terrae]|jgi:hypothetical protein